MGDGEITGRVLHRGAPQAGCQVLAVDEAAGAVVADDETGADGRWRLDAEGVLVVGRCRGDALGVVLARPGAGADDLDLEITAVAPTYPLSLRLEGRDMEDWVTPRVLLTPLGIADLDEGLLRWVHAPVRGMSSGALARFTPPDRRLERFVQAGRWWVGAEFERVPDVRAEGMPDAIRWTAVRARTSGGEELAPLKDGFALDVDGPIDVTITMEREAAPSDEVWRGPRG
jgi:hypothetical protein